MTNQFGNNAMRIKYVKSFWARKKTQLLGVNTSEVTDEDIISCINEKRKKSVNEILAYRFYGLMLATPKAYIVEEPVKNECGRVDISIFTQIPDSEYTTLGERLKTMPATSLPPKVKRQLGKLFAIADFIMDPDALGPSYTNILITEDDEIYKIDPAEANLLINNMSNKDYAGMVAGSHLSPIVAMPEIQAVYGSSRYNETLHRELKDDSDYLDGLAIGYQTIAQMPAEVLVGIITDLQNELDNTAYALSDQECMKLFRTLTNRQVQIERRPNLNNEPLYSPFPPDYIKPAGVLRSIQDFDYFTPLNKKVDKFVEFTPSAKVVKEIATLLRRTFGKEIPKDLEKINSLLDQMLDTKITDDLALLLVESILAKQCFHQHAIKNEMMKKFANQVLALINNQTYYSYDQHVKNFRASFLRPTDDFNVAREFQPQIKQIMAEANAIYRKFLTGNQGNIEKLMCFHLQMQQYLAHRYGELAETIAYGKRSQSPTYKKLLEKVAELCIIDTTGEKKTDTLFSPCIDNRKIQRFLSDNKKLLRTNAEMLERKYNSNKIHVEEPQEMSSKLGYC